MNITPEPEEPISVVPFPTLHQDAYTGLPGKIVEAVAPHTEAHPAPILLQYLARYGVHIGPHPHVLAANAKHPARINPLILGKTSTGAKGTSYSVVDALYRAAERADPDGYGEPVRDVSGLSTGEGLIEMVRDPDPERDVPGVDDKRLLVVEEEFVSVLAAAERNGSTLPAVMRKLWDGARVQTVTKKDPMTATDAHVSVIGHATPGELRAKMSDAQLDGGTMNRFVPCASRRTKNLPEGGNLPVEVLDEFGPLIAQSIEHGRTKVLPLVERSPEAGDLWAASYADLRRDRPDGAVAKMLARAAPNTLRVALAYALADGKRQIDVEHMRAALALWRYAEQSAEWLFGGQIDTGELESLVAYITTAGPTGRTRTEISVEHFQRHRTATEIDAMLATLIGDGRVKQETEPRSGRGRPAVRYYAC